MNSGDWLRQMLENTPWPSTLAEKSAAFRWLQYKDLPLEEQRHAFVLLRELIELNQRDTGTAAQVLERLGREMLRLAADIRPDPEHSLKAKVIWNAAIAEAQIAVQRYGELNGVELGGVCAELQKLLR